MLFSIVAMELYVQVNLIDTLLSHSCDLRSLSLYVCGTTMTHETQIDESKSKSLYSSSPGLSVSSTVCFNQVKLKMCKLKCSYSKSL